MDTDNRIALVVDDILEGRLPNELIDYPVTKLIGIAHMCPDCGTILSYRKYPEHNETYYYCEGCWRQWNPDDLIQIYSSKEWEAKVQKKIELSKIMVEITYNPRVATPQFITTVFGGQASRELGIVSVRLDGAK